MFAVLFSFFGLWLLLFVCGVLICYVLLCNFALVLLYCGYLGSELGLVVWLSFCLFRCAGLGCLFVM